MDAHSLLTSQGWRGSGHSLHPTSDNRGLLRPILVSRKPNTLGVGKKQNRTSDMWWLDAFDKSLKTLETTEEGKAVQPVNNGGLDMVAKGESKFVRSGGLYTFFIRGESLTGTISENRDPPLSAGNPKLKMVTIKTKQKRKIKRSTKRVTGLLEGISLAPRAADEVIDASDAREQNEECQRLMNLPYEHERSYINTIAVARSTNGKKKRKDKC